MKDFFPNWKKAVGMIVVTAAGVMLWNVINRVTGAEAKVSNAVQRTGMKKAA